MQEGDDSGVWIDAGTALDGPVASAWRCGREERLVRVPVGFGLRLMVRCHLFLPVVVTTLVLTLAAAVLVPGPSAAADEGSGAFGDDDGSFHERALDALAAEGYLAGTECESGGICPSEPLKRWEMAVWLGRALSGGEPASIDRSRFADVDAGEWWAPHVERFAALGVTAGCDTGPLRYCPEEPVTRAQMATFLVRAFNLRAAPDAGFGDTVGNFHESSINALAAAGVTAGCRTEPLSYCPNKAVTRAEMATFLARALGLIPLPAAARFKAVDAGAWHTCALRADDTVVCWGGNANRQAEAPDGRYKAITAGAWHSCALGTDNAVTCWGDNEHGQAEAPSGRFETISAGGGFTCGLGADGSITCWGSNGEGQTDVPDGDYRDVSAGGSHSCALGVDGTVTCWGANWFGQTDAPEGRYKAIAAGNSHSCALRSDNTAICWGSNWYGESDTPTKRLIAVAAGSEHSCGLGVDGTVTCWGANLRGEAHPPEGAFEAITTGVRHSCGLRADNRIACWGHGGYDPSEQPEGRFIDVSAGVQHSCAVRTDSTVACWGLDNDGQSFSPAGAFESVSLGLWHTCGLGTDGSVECWGDDSEGQASPPEGEFEAVASGTHHSCALRTDDTIACWGSIEDPPDGRYTSVTVGDSYSCAIGTDSTVTCWGANWLGQADAPEGKYKAVDAGRWHSCAIAADSTVTCWGDRSYGKADAPEGKYKAIAAGAEHSCAVRTDDTLTCWGANWYGQADAPGGKYKAVTAGSGHSCALRLDGVIECWGPTLVIRAPNTIEFPYDWDPGTCRIFSPWGLWGDVTAGFPLPRVAPSATGTLRVAVLFADFPDAASTYSAKQEAEQGLRYAEEYLESASYGKLDVEFRPLDRWLRAGHGYSNYAVELGQGVAVVEAIDNEAVLQADPVFDFAGHEALLIVMPSSHFEGGNVVSGEYLEGRITTAEGTLTSIARVNTRPLSDPALAAEWGFVAAHELGHNLGLLDMYPYDDSRHVLPEPPAGKDWVTAQFGLMQGRANFLANEDDPRLASTWTEPDGTLGSGYTNYLQASEMLAWSRWQLGWLDPSQVRCVTRGSTTVTLSPVADPGDGVAMAAIPLSDTQTIVVESRRKIGYDDQTETRYLDGWRVTHPALLDDGVLVYTVDARLGSGDLPVKFANDDGSGQVTGYPLLTEGESLTVRGYTITVTSDDGRTHTVRISGSGS